MLRDKVDPSAILAYTVRSGYGGSLKTMQNYIDLLAKNNFKVILPMNWAYKFEYPENVIMIKRNEILRYITIKNPKVKRDETIEKYLDIIKERYEIVAVLAKAYDEFYKTLMGKDPDRLEDFIMDYETSAIEGFVGGIKKDITPVRNAISSDASSGFVVITSRLLFPVKH